MDDIESIFIIFSFIHVKMLKKSTSGQQLDNAVQQKIRKYA